MKAASRLSVCFFILVGVLSLSAPAWAQISLGKGNSSLLGGDLTDPEDKIVPSTENIGRDLSESALKPPNATWVKMTCSPANGPGTPPHQRHPYQSWQGSPACAIFLNRPQKMKWYVGFKDGGYGGPTRADPYFAAIELKGAFTLTHFTITASPDMPGRDPKAWAIQGSNTGAKDDWTDIYVCKAKDRNSSPFQNGSRCETFLYTSFTSDDMAKSVTPADAKKLNAKPAAKKIKTANFTRPAKTYTWFRVAIYSCFNPNSLKVADFNRPAGFSLSQLELFGVPGAKAKPSPKAPKATEASVKPPVYDAPFIISYWCGPPKAQTTLDRYKEIAECGMNVAFIPIDGSDEKTNRKILDLCRTVGIKALVSIDLPASEKAPDFAKVLDAQIAMYSSHPALLGYHLRDEPNSKAFGFLGAVNKYLLKKDPRHLPYINLFPNYASPDQLGNKTYSLHVREYIETVKPALVSWDHYKQMAGNEKFYWPNLEIVRFHCLQAKTPLIQIICSLPHFNYRDPSEADLRWQVYTSLAYGSRGIIYFTYWDVKELATNQGPAIITMDGKRDKKYGYVRSINNRIARLGPTLVRLTSTGVYHTDPVPSGSQRLAGGAPVKKADGGPMVIGCFRDAKGLDYIMPVNRSFGKKITARLAMKEEFLSASEISQETGKPLTPVSLSPKTLDISLEPGEGRLYLLNRKK